MSIEKLIEENTAALNRLADNLEKVLVADKTDNTEVEKKEAPAKKAPVKKATEKAAAEDKVAETKPEADKTDEADKTAEVENVSKEKAISKAEISRITLDYVRKFGREKLKERFAQFGADVTSATHLAADQYKEYHDLLSSDLNA